jgi:oxygen-independent coproporphyrinogen-3 oxidase
MQTEFLKNLGRAHSREQAFTALETVFAAGFDNVSVDLLCGIPGQSLEHLNESMTLLTQFPITHLSCYLLTLPPHHRMYSALPDEDTQLSHLLYIDEWMTQAGFDHYEISNFAKPGRKAQHNLRYWNSQSYLGLGPSAHSFDSVRSQRWKNVSSLHQYASLLNQGESAVESTECLTFEQLELEKWMLALRLDTGFPLAWLTTKWQQDQVKLFKNEGLLEQHPTIIENYRLTPRGFALSDQVIRTLA